VNSFAHAAGIPFRCGRSGVQQLGAPFYVEYFFNGGILIVAVALSVYAAIRRRKAAVKAAS